MGMSKKTDELLSLLLCASYTWYEVRRYVFECCVGRENAFVLDLMLCNNHTGKRYGYWHKGKSLKHGCRCCCRCCCCAAAVPLYADFVIAHTPRTHMWYLQKGTNLHTGAPSVAITKEIYHSTAAVAPRLPQVVSHFNARDKS